MPSKFLIYALSDPRTNEIRYIGQSSRGLKRPKHHMCPSSIKGGHNPYKNNWLRQLKSLGLNPIIDVLEELISEDQLDENEQFYIAYFRSIGCRLVNLTDGGKGMRGYSLSKETRTKMSLSHKGKKQSSEHIANNVAANTGRKVSETTKAKISLANSGRIYSEEMKIKLAISHGGRPFCDETGRIYHSQTEASKALDINQSNLWKCLNNQASHAGGHVFAYLGPDCDLQIKERQELAAKRPISRPFKDENGNIYRIQSEASKALKIPKHKIGLCLRSEIKQIKGHTLTYLSPPDQTCK